MMNSNDEEGRKNAIQANIPCLSLFDICGLNYFKKHFFPFALKYASFIRFCFNTCSWWVWLRTRSGTHCPPVPFGSFFCNFYVPSYLGRYYFYSESGRFQIQNKMLSQTVSRRQETDKESRWVSALHTLFIPPVVFSMLFLNKTVCVFLFLKWGKERNGDTFYSYRISDSHL